MAISTNETDEVLKEENDGREDSEKGRCVGESGSGDILRTVHPAGDNDTAEVAADAPSYEQLQKHVNYLIESHVAKDDAIRKICYKISNKQDVDDYAGLVQEFFNLIGKTKTTLEPVSPTHPPSDAPSDEPVTPPDWRGESCHNQWDASPSAPMHYDDTHQHNHEELWKWIDRVQGSANQNADAIEKIEQQITDLIADRTVNPADVDHDAHADAHRKIEQQINSHKEYIDKSIETADIVRQLRQQIAKLEHRPSEKGEE